MARYWRVYFTSPMSGGNISMAELEFISSGVNQSIGKEFWYSSQFDDNRHAARNAIDGVKIGSNLWASATNQIPSWFSIDCGSDITIDEIKITSRSGSLEQSPASFIVQKSIDNTTWEDVWEQSISSLWTDLETRSFSLIPVTTAESTMNKKSVLGFLTTSSKAQIGIAVNASLASKPRVNKGNGYISGRINNNAEPTKLTLIDRQNQRIVKEVLADAIGEYTFPNIRSDLTYDVIATDLSGLWESKVSSRRTPIVVLDPDIRNAEYRHGEVFKFGIETENSVKPVYTMSSEYEAAPKPVSYEVLNDGDLQTGAGSGFVGTEEWIKADLGGPRAFSKITVAGGNLQGWGTNISAWMNGAELQYSNNEVDWTVIATLQNISNTQPTVYTFPHVVAQYVRLLMRNNYIGTTEFRIE